MASIKIAITSQYYSINPFKLLKWKILNCDCNVNCNMCTCNESLS